MSKQLSPSVNYIFRILITAALFYGSTQVRFLLSFIPLYNYDYSPFWPAGGIAFALMIRWGYSIWPGIVIGSLLVSFGMKWWDTDTHSLIEILITTFLFAFGRTIEPIIGTYLLDKFKIRQNPFHSPGNSLKYILVVFIAAWISTLFGSFGFEILEASNLEVFRNRTIAWYIDHIVGMFIMATLVLSIFQLIDNKKRFIGTLSIPTLTVLIFSFLFLLVTPKINSFELLILDSLPFLIIPIIILLAFNYDLFVSSFLIVVLSIFILYFTIKGFGVFVVNGDWEQSIWLIQSYLIVGALTNIILYSAANERRANEELLAHHSQELQQTNQKLNHALTDLKKLMAKAEVSERLKSSFLANISHEIRTPMNAILGFAELLERTDLTENKKKEFTRLLKQRSNDLLKIMDEIVLVSQLEANHEISEKGEVNLEELFSSLQTEFEGKVNQRHGSEVMLTHKVSLPEGKKTIHVNREFLKMVLSRLLDNANKFTSKGKIEFSCKYVSPEMLQFSVSDTGIGIERGSTGVIFEPFRHADESIHIKYGGMGAGLAVCKAIVTHWGGSIRVESELGKGSEFLFTLPVQKIKDSTESKMITR